MRLLRSFALAIASLPIAAAADLRTLPEHPVAGEPFIAMFTDRVIPGGTSSTSYASLPTVSAGELTMTVDFSKPLPGTFRGICGAEPCYGPTYETRTVVTIPEPGSYQGYFVYTGLPYGTYPLGRQRSPDSVIVGAARPSAAPLRTTLSGNYFAEDENGSGLNLLQSASGQLFVGWFFYQAQRTATFNELAPAWYVSGGGTWISPTRFTTILYETRGTAYNKPFVASDLNVGAVGILTLDVIDANTIDMDVTLVSGVRKQKRLSRLLF
ncbi:hypothetical protein BWI17_17110 [Betaproteobacteria bacterium GR16-43]|nr:hypothetical protein BWI17_17110 [Betaproteobacteria bacterium GR16-43]